MALRAGFARTDITPGRELDLLGYDYRQERLPPGNAGALDPLHVRALALADGDERAVLVAIDLCVVSVPLARRLRAAAATAAGTTPERVVLACSHTHSGPLLADPPIVGDLRAALPHAVDGGVHAERYTAGLDAAVADAAGRAAGLLVPVSAGVRAAPFALAYDRRVATADGVHHCWNPQEYPDLDPRPTADPACAALVLRQLDGPRTWIAWNLGAHPVCLGKTSRVVSADWPGAACAAVDAALGPHGGSLFTLGACGDTQPWVATQEDPALMRLVGTAAGAFVATLAQAVRPQTEARLRVATRTVTLGGAELDLAAWRIGEALLLAAPVELFASLGAGLRRRVASPLLLATNANGWTGYWPAQADFAGGGYEIPAATAIGRAAGDGERLVDALVELAAQLG